MSAKRDVYVASTVDENLKERKNLLEIMEYLTNLCVLHKLRYFVLNEMKRKVMKNKNLLIIIFIHSFVKFLYLISYTITRI